MSEPFQYIADPSELRDIDLEVYCRRLENESERIKRLKIHLDELQKIEKYRNTITEGLKPFIGKQKFSIILLCGDLLNEKGQLDWRKYLAHLESIANLCGAESYLIADCDNSKILSSVDESGNPVDVHNEDQRYWKITFKKK